MTVRCDVLVLGTGAAGLALAAHPATAHRATAPPATAHPATAPPATAPPATAPPATAPPATARRAARRVVLVDAADEPVAGRAWAYWSARRSLLDAAVSGTWSRLAVRAGGRRLVLPTDPFSYRLVRGDDLTALVEHLIGADDAFTRLTGPVRALDVRPDRVIADVAGTRVEADWVLDSRPPPPPAPGECDLRFLGWEIDAPGAAFDPGVATFMDFAVRVPGQVRFCYVLPTGPHHALVEVACFAAVPEPPPSGSPLAPSGPGPGPRGPRPDLGAALAGYLRGTWGLDSWQVVRQESGDLPLRVPGARGEARVLRVGAAGGMLKPSTGYAFDRMVRDAAAVARSLDRFGHPWALPRRHRRHAWLDRILLDVVRDRPEAVEPAFAQLFARNRLPQVLRFLDEDTRPAEEVRLIATLPPGPFLAAALRRCGTTLGRAPRARRTG